MDCVEGYSQVYGLAYELEILSHPQTEGLHHLLFMVFLVRIVEEFFQHVACARIPGPKWLLATKN